MQENHLFEYAVIRFVPMVEREEFLNIGVILLCAKEKFLQLRFELDEDRLKVICPQVDLKELKEQLQSFERICKGGPEGGSIGKLSIPERFRWLTATRSTVVQTSKVHPGLCTDASEMLDRLYRQLVLR
ncbi:MAG TPA: DUF3037 domain-containing protein [Cyclobacteriaceae bacterium]